nr:ornithine carbamoyltransferase, mitochondrial-like [Leptinotarsa decemlineata]
MSLTCQNMKYILRNLSKQNPHKWKISLKGRKYLSPTDLSPEEMNYLLSTATNLEKGICVNKRALAGRSITILLNQPCLKMQTCIYNTAKMLKMSINLLIHTNWTACQNPLDAGKLLSTGSDIIFCQSPRHSKLQMFAQGATVPVLNLSSCQFVSLNILSDLLTLQKHFGKVDGLTLAWIGKPCPLMNTYLSIAPLLGVRIKYYSVCGGPMSPLAIHNLQERDEVYKERVTECKDIKQAVSGAQVIMTNNHTEKSMTLKKADLDKYADQRWVFLHNLPRSSIEVEEEIFQSEKNLLWKSFCNAKWVCAAIITRFIDVPY